MMSALDRRRSGILLHLASLPVEAGRGVLGAAAYRAIDLLADAGFSVWQMLPVGPVGEDRSPYYSASAHAGNVEFIDRSLAPAPEAVLDEYAAFVDSNRHWLFDDALFVALKAENDGRSWWQWPPTLRDRDPEALTQALERHRASSERFIFEQFLFHRQWQAVRSYARARGVLLFGDMPIYVAHDSAEVWAHREDFQLDPHGLTIAVAGVPPDYFSKDGQRWGNPLYDWEGLAARGFSTWVERMRTQLTRFDLIRLDHFRGLEAYWSVPADAQTARDGIWLKAPGEALLERLTAVFGALPLVAEDLGMITPEVLALRDRHHLPGMHVLQFAFDGSPHNPHLPHNHVRNAVVYTGTHDNDTTLGWYRALDENARRLTNDYLRCTAHDMPDALVRAALESVALLAVIPLPDLQALGTEARMNTPGTTSGNWRWAFEWRDIPADFAQRWRRFNHLYGRV